MGKINWVRVILGGLAAGVVINLFEYLANGVYLAKDWDAAMKALGHSMPPGAVTGFVIWGFLVGITSVATYAVARPRFGPGPKAAVASALGYWVIGYMLPNTVTMQMGLFPLRLLLIGTFIGLLEIVVATLVGAWLYAERAA
jgi:hypothetical protein